MDLDLHGVNGVGQAVADHEGSQAVVGAVSVEAWDDLGGLVVERDDDLAAVGTDEVVEGATGAFELEGDGLAGLRASVQVRQAGGPAFAEVVRFHIDGGDAAGKGGGADGDELGVLVVLRIQSGAE